MNTTNSLSIQIRDEIDGGYEYRGRDTKFTLWAEEAERLERELAEWRNGSAQVNGKLLAEIEKLRSQLDNPGTTHSAGCWSWGPKHYECAKAEIERLRALAASDRDELADLRPDFEQLTLENKRLRAALAEIASRTDWDRDTCGKAAHDAYFSNNPEGQS